MYGEFDNIKICGIASAAPKRVVDNEIIAEKLGNRRAKKQTALNSVRKVLEIRKIQQSFW